MVHVFCDFDGTVSLQDVGELFFRNYAAEKADQNIQRLLSGEMTMQKWLTELCETIPSISKKEFYDFIDQFIVDLHFTEFVRFCNEQDIRLLVLSDGLDKYVKRVLANAGLHDVPFFANHAEFVNVNGTEKLTVSFPYTDAECNLCGNCKRNHMLNTSADDDIIVPKFVSAIKNERKNKTGGMV